MATNRAETVSVRGRPQQVAVWRAAAAHEDVRLSEFLRRAADTYARAKLTSLENRADAARVASVG